MDMVNAYDVLEDTRKFLSLPQTVIFMATYLRQLRTLVAKQYEKALSLPRSSKDIESEPTDCTQIAAKYLDKLIPSQQMVHINSFRYQRDLNGKLKIGDFIDDLSDVRADKKTGSAFSEADLDADLEEEFYALIRRKTGLIFLKHDTYVNNILPTTLRGLVHLYQLLDKMETPQFPKESDYEEQMATHDASYYRQYINALGVQQRNLILFEDYFRNDWCYINLKEKDQEILWAISQAHMVPKLKIIHNLLKKRWDWVKEWKSVIPDSNTNSFTDMVMILDLGEHSAESMEDLFLVFAIRTHLSICMHKLYYSEVLMTLATSDVYNGFYNVNDKHINNKPGQLKNDSQFDIGVYRWIEHKQLLAFIRADTREAVNPNDVGKKLAVDNPIGYSIPDRINLLYSLLFDKCSDVTDRFSAFSLNKLYFGLQAATFRVLGNHDVLRLWLTNMPDRFKKSTHYVGAVRDVDPDNSNEFMLWDEKPEKQESIAFVWDLIREGVSPTSEEPETYDSHPNNNEEMANVLEGEAAAEANLHET